MIRISPGPQTQRYAVPRADTRGDGHGRRGSTGRTASCRMTVLQRLGLSLSSAVRRARRRVADVGWSIVQTPVAAALAWYIAHTLLGHPQPFFAPVAAAVSLSKGTLLRGQCALQLIVGVVIAIGVGTAVKAVASSPPGRSSAVAIAVAVLLALVAALAVGGGFFEQGALFVNQSATSAILMIAVAGAATGSERLSDALIGSGVTFVITVVLFPRRPPAAHPGRGPAGVRRATRYARSPRGVGRSGQDSRPGLGARCWTAHPGPACWAPRGPVDRPPGREPRAAPLARTVSGPPGRRTDRAAPIARCHRCEPGARQHRRVRCPAAASPRSARSPGRADVGVRSLGRRGLLQRHSGGPARRPGPRTDHRRCAGERPAPAAHRETRRGRRRRHAAAYRQTGNRVLLSGDAVMTTRRARSRATPSSV